MMAATAIPEITKQLEQSTPLKRLGQLEEVAGLAIYLLSDESSYSTGMVHAACGGMLI